MVRRSKDLEGKTYITEKIINQFILMCLKMIIKKLLMIILIEKKRKIYFR